MDACATKPIDAAALFRIIDELVTPRADGGAEERVELPASDDIVADIAAHPRFRAEARAIDPTTIEQLQGLGGEAFVADLARVFLKEGERILEELRASVANGDYEHFRDRMHALRSGAANIGALPLYHLCLSLRGIGAAAFAEQGAEKARQIEAEFARVRRELCESYCDLPSDGDAAAGAAGAEESARGGEAESPVIRPLRAAAGRSSVDSAPS